MRSVLLRYAIPVVLSAALVALKWAAFPQMGREAPLLLALVPTLVAAWYGGFGPGLVATALSAAAVSYLSWPHTPLGTVQLLLWCFEGVVVAAATAAVHSSQAAAEELARRLRGLYGVSSALGGASTPHEVAEVILHEVVALGAASVLVYLVPDGGGSLRLLAYRGPDARSFEPERASHQMKEIPLDADLPGALSARNRAVVSVESEEELLARFPSARDVWSGHLPPALICAPMIVRGQMIGVLVVTLPKARRFSSEERSWMQALAQDCGMAVERTRLSETQQRWRLEAEGANLAKDEFLRSVSRELRSPLTAIVGWAHVLKQVKERDRSRYEHGLDIIERSALSEGRIVDDILDMTRIAARKLRVEMRPIELSPVVRACVDELRVVAAARGVALETGPDVKATVAADAERLRQVTYNVVSNALKFTPPGGHVRVEMSSGDHRAIVRVRDDGRGIPPAELPHVFDAFHRTQGPSMGREGGLGLGLAIAKHIVQEHRGAIRVESPGVGRGTTVTVELPLAEGVVGASGVSEEPRVASATLLAGLHVLLVDDDADAREVLAEILGAEGATVRKAASAQSAIEELRDFTPGVIVGDLGMPNEDGYRLMRQVRALPAPLAGAPAVALADSARPDDAQAAMAAGYQRCISKPVDPRALVETLTQLGAKAA